jgi:sigma-B regulation protein RsbU (phosphoserine phosphatase)
VPRDTPALPSADPPSRARALREWLLSTFAGRALLVGVAIKLVAFLLSLIAGRSRGLEAFDAIGDVALVAATIALGYRLYVDAKRRLLWRVRRKLIVSYIFIGFVPVMLVISFFMVSGALLFFNMSAYMLRTRIATFVDQTRFLAQSAALEIQRSHTPNELMETLARRQAAADMRYPMASYALVPAAQACGDAAGTRPSVAAPTALATEAAGPWAHMPAPRSVPDWLKCRTFAGLITPTQTNTTTPLVIRAVAWPDGVPGAVIVDVPIGAALKREVHDEMGISMGEGSSVASDEAGDARSRRTVTVGSPAIGGDLQEPLGWVTPLDHTNWDTGEMSAVAVGYRMGLGAVFTALSGPSFDRLNRFTLGQIFFVGLAVVGVLFLIIQAVALVMGLTLARSITGSVHELFTGTERVRRGDFTHKIAILSRDQLGELAASFNSMTGSIEELLQQKAEKERLEQELRIARSIQMSLLPQSSLTFPGVSLSGHCEPAREVGGDYYDFLPLDDSRMGILIADVAGKGTSAALYMAELKGLVLSLSQRHASPRELLIDANRIISKHLDARSFITMTYAVVDIAARTMTLARAGHCPLVYVPGPQAASRAAKALQPDGMVLGLQFDTGEIFSRTLEELTVPLGAGDLFLLYTDGISEAMNVDGDYFGETRLADLAQQYADLRSEELSARILGEVKAFAGAAAQHDDMTMVLLKIEDR